MVSALIKPTAVVHAKFVDVVIDVAIDHSWRCTSLWPLTELRMVQPTLQD